MTRDQPASDEEASTPSASKEESLKPTDSGPSSTKALLPSGNARRIHRRSRHYAGNRSTNEGDSAEPKRAVSITHSSWVGPLPPPQFLRDYDDIVPGAANRFIELTEREQLHRHSIETWLVRGDVIRSLTGVGAAIVLSALFLGAGVYLISQGHEWTGGIIGLSGLTGLVTAFLRGTNRLAASRKRTPEEKKKENKESQDKAN